MGEFRFAISVFHRQVLFAECKFNEFKLASVFLFTLSGAGALVTAIAPKQTCLGVVPKRQSQDLANNPFA